MGTIKLRPFLTRCYQAYGPVFQLTVPGQKITVLAGPEANLFAMKEGHRVLRSLEAWRDNDHEMGSDRSMISLDGAEHRAYRRVEGRAYSRSFFAAGLRPALAVLAEDLAPFQPGDVLPVATWCKKTITEQLARMAVGGTTRPYLPDLLHFIQTALQVTVNRQLPAAVLRLPHYRRAKARIFQMVDDLIEEHRQNPPETSGRAPDLIDDILADQQLHPELWGHADVRIAALGAFIAGMDTAANSLAFVLYRMHLHSEFLPALAAGRGRRAVQGRSPHRRGPGPLAAAAPLRDGNAACPSHRPRPEPHADRGRGIRRAPHPRRHPRHHRDHRAAWPARTVPRPRAVRP